MPIKSVFDVLGLRGPVLAALALLSLPPITADAQYVCPSNGWVCSEQLPNDPWPPGYCYCDFSLYQTTLRAEHYLLPMPGGPSVLVRNQLLGGTRDL